MGEGLSGQNLGSDCLSLSVVVGIGFPPLLSVWVLPPGSDCAPSEAGISLGPQPCCVRPPLAVWGCLCVSDPCHLISPMSVRLSPPSLGLPFGERLLWVCLLLSVCTWGPSAGG